MFDQYQYGQSPYHRTKILDFRGFDSSILLILRVGILMSIGDFPEMLSHKVLVGRLRVVPVGHIQTRPSRTVPFGPLLPHRLHVQRRRAPEISRAKRSLPMPEKGGVLLRGVGTLRYLFPPNASVQWQPDGLTIRTQKWFLGAGFLGALPISLTRVGSSQRGV